MVLPTREDAQFLSDAVQGDGDPLSVLEEFANSPRPTPEELKTFEYAMAPRRPGPLGESPEAAGRPLGAGRP